MCFAREEFLFNGRLLLSGRGATLWRRLLHLTGHDCHLANKNKKGSDG